ncbi:MAG: FAD:protein FMN transferase, partial [Aquificota bacterium]
MFFKNINEIRDKVMSTEILIKAKTSKKVLDECLEIARDFEEKLSAYKPNSYVSKINQMAGKEPVSCPQIVVDVIKEAIEVATITNGRFDPTIGVLTQKTYGFGTGKEKIPSKEEIEKKKKLINYKDVEIFGSSVYLKKEGMALDLGGIGKGFASQLIAEYLKRKGADCGLVSIGGEICCYGRNWNIAIRHPRKNKFLAIITTKNTDTTISTSGDYERYINSYENHHIIDSKTGKQNLYYSSLTLVLDKLEGGKLDAYTTALFNTRNIISEA